jgi:hypothetical protein
MYRQHEIKIRRCCYDANFCFFLFSIYLDIPAQVPPLTPGTNKKMTEALKASFASWEKEQERLGIPKGNNYISILFSSFSLPFRQFEHDTPTQTRKFIVKKNRARSSFSTTGNLLLLLLLLLRQAAATHPNKGRAFLLCTTIESYYLSFFNFFRLLPSLTPSISIRDCVCWNKKVNISASLIPDTEAHETNRPQSSLVFHRGVMGGL